MTLRDVARHCNVSISTVSRVLNGTSTVNPDIAERVRKAAVDLGYTPNMAGRQLRLHVDPEFGPDFSTRQADHSLEKRSIGLAAAALCPPNAFVALDSGSTVSTMASALSPDVVVFTNSLAPLQQLARRGVATHLSGGLYVPAMGALFGPETEAFARSHPVAYYFLSSARVDVRAGLFNVNPMTIGVKTAWMDHAMTVVLLADHTKFVDIGLKAYAPLSAVDVLVTDAIPEEYRDMVLSQVPRVIETVNTDTLRGAQ